MLRSRKQFTAIAFPGARWAIEYSPSRLIIHQPTGSAVVDYSILERVIRGSGNTVILKDRSRLFMVLPGKLCPPSAVAFLTDAIARADNPNQLSDERASTSPSGMVAASPNPSVDPDGV